MPLCAKNMLRIPDYPEDVCAFTATDIGTISQTSAKFSMELRSPELMEIFLGENDVCFSGKNMNHLSWQANCRDAIDLLKAMQVQRMSTLTGRTAAS